MRRSALLSIALITLAGPAAAQTRADQARLSFGVGLGYNGGSDLWGVQNQIIFGQFGTDSADVSRLVRPTIGVSFLGVYYPNPRFGVSGEIHLLGLGYEDHCRLTTNSGDADSKMICNNLNGAQSPGTAVAATVGGIFRPFPWTGLQPYVRGNVGVVLSEQSTLRVNVIYRSAFDTTQYSDYPLFEDRHPASISPTGAFALGATGFISRSTQLRIEVKDNLVILKEVEGTTAYLAREPAWQQRVHHIMTLNVGMEVVLEKRRGRRY